MEFPILKNPSLDFCNSFWGFGDAGVDVLFARMRGAAQTTEDLNEFWKERASIEEDYAKRLAKLAQMGLGRDEIGDLRKSLDTMVAKTKSQARFHLSLAQQFRSELEIPTTAFHVRLLHHKTTHQVDIEKLFKKKQSLESYVPELNENYKRACAQKGSLEAQFRGKDRETQINIELEHIQTRENIQFYERELSYISMALKETVTKWEQGWKSFCDSCQDMEEDRMNFMKNILLNYADTASEVYHMADGACYESMRVSFDRMAGEKDLATFVLKSGSGNKLPDPFDFVNYSPVAIPSAWVGLTSRIAEFTRSTSRVAPPQQHMSNEAGPSAIPTRRRFFFRRPSSNASTTSVASDASISTTLPDYSDVLPEGQTELGEVPRSSIVPEQLPNTISTSQRARRSLPRMGTRLADWQPVLEGHMSPSQRNRTAGIHALSDEKGVAGYEDPGMDTLRRWFGAFGSIIHARTPRRMSQSSNTSNRQMRPLGAVTPYDYTPSWVSSSLPPPQSLADMKWHRLDDAPVSRDDASSLRAPSVRSQLVNKRLTIKFDDQEIVNSSIRPGQPQSPTTHEHRQAIHGPILIPDGYPRNQISTGGDGGGAQLPAETLQHHDPSNPVWRSPSKPLFQAVDDVLDSDEPEMRMPVMLPQTSGQFNSFLKQHEHNSLNSNVNPINFVIKKMMKARRIAHSTYSTSVSSMKVDTDSFISRFSDSAENFSPASLR